MNLELALESVRRFFRRRVVVLAFSVLLVSFVVALVGAIIYNTMQMQSHVGVQSILNLFFS